MKRLVVLSTLLLTFALIVSACAAPPPTTAPPTTAPPTAAPQPTAAPPTTAPTKAPVVTDEWGTVTVKKGDTIKASFSAALTGDLAVYGLDMQLGAQLAAADFGKNVLSGFNIEIVSEDDLCSGPGGTTVANKIAANAQIVAHIGFMCSSGEIPGTEILDKAHIVSISPSATAVQVTARGLATVNRTAFNDKIQGPADADFVLKQLKLTSAAVLHDGSPYGQGLAQAFKDAFEKSGGKSTAFEAVTVGEKDFRATLTKIAAGKPQLIFFGGFWPEAAVMVVQKNEVGLKDTVFMSADGTFTPKFIETAKDAAQGAYASFGSSQQGASYDAFVKAYVAKGGKKENIVFSPQTYDAVNVLAVALKSVGKVDADGNLVIGRKALADAVRKVKVEGTTGAITFDNTGDRPPESTNVVINQVKGNDWVQAFPPPKTPALPDLKGRQVTVAIENAYIPFNYVRLDNGKAEGWDYDALAEICKRLNCKPVFKEIAWDGMITAVGQKQFDMAADGITITTERAKTVDFSIGYMAVDQRVMVRGDDNRFKNASELQGNKTVKLGSQKGTTNYDEAVKLVGEKQVVGFDTFGDVVQALINKDVDGVVIDDVAGRGYIGVNKDKIKMLAGVLVSQDLGFVFPKGSDLVAAFNAALQAMKADGALDTLKAKWFPAGKEVIGDDKIGPGAYAPPTPTPKP